jgi:hypothetical protein
MAGQTASQVSNDIASVENANVGIVNQVNGTNAQLSEQGTSRNVELRKRYDDEMAVLNQQTDNAQETLKNRNLKNWMDGVNNKMKTDWLESVTPQINVDRMTGEIGFTGKGKQIGNNYEYSDYAGANIGTYTQNMLDQYKPMYKTLNWTDAEIHAHQGQIMKSILTNRELSKGQIDPRTQAAQNLLDNIGQ